MLCCGYIYSWKIIWYKSCDATYPMQCCDECLTQYWNSILHHKFGLILHNKYYARLESNLFLTNTVYHVLCKISQYLWYKIEFQYCVTISSQYCTSYIAYRIYTRLFFNSISNHSITIFPNKPAEIFDEIWIDSWAGRLGNVKHL